ncbi:hypothetical protein TSUD_390100 [Trifolium subterraneum]|uniref:Uncharacterized protein n=1 Tax=Trifolium subterraneum TaxID=3900 RepID=A0A2Z6NHM1_TRISU|nr:hypothetical protein TSUD_390100 [Trifolium subterraneum]
MACENKNTQREKFGSFSETEIDVAKHLIQLSSGGSESSTINSDETRHSNSSNSVTFEKKGSDEISQPSSPADSVEDVLAEIEEDERLRRKNKRFRYIEDLYRVTVPIVNTPPSFDKK